MQKIIISGEDVNKRLDIFLQEKLKVSRSHVKNMIENGYVLHNGKIVKSGQKLKTNDIVEYQEIQPKQLDLSAQNIDLDIVYQDNDMAIINKPQGMVVHPAGGSESGTLVNALLFHLKDLSTINGVVRPGIVHRLDKNTSGLLVVAKNDKAHINLQKQIQSKTCHRHYLALCHGNFKDDNGTITTHIARSQKDRKQMAVCDSQKGKLAITHYHVLKRFNGYTFVEFVLDTGRTHQIRVHCKHIGHPIVGDDVYGTKDKIKTNGQLLHAYKLELDQPTTNQRLTFEAKLPDYFEEIIKKLKEI